MPDAQTATLEHHAHAHPEALEHQFDDMHQQHTSINLGMWVFLATEVMFFGGLFASYTIFRCLGPAYTQGFGEAAKEHMDVTLGTINTAVLLCSSLAMALAVHSAQLGKQRGQILYLIATMVLACTFLGIKVVEYHEEYVNQLVPGLNFNFQHYEGPYPHQAALFFCFYFIMTGFHALHMIIGVAIMAVYVALAWRRPFTADTSSSFESLGLYWHFVDIVWVFLFPILYLMDIH